MQIHHIQLLQKNGHPTWSSANCFLKNAEKIMAIPTIRFRQKFMANILQRKEISQLRPLTNMTSLEGGKAFRLFLTRSVTFWRGKIVYQKIEGCNYEAW